MSAPSNALATEERSTPMRATWSGLDTVTLIGCLVLGSNAASVTCWACWVAVTRGLNERSVCGHSQRDRVVGARLAEVRVGVLDHELEPDPLGQSPDEVPVGLVVLLHEVVGIAAAVALGAEPRLAEDLGDDVARGLVLERADLARADEGVRAVKAADHQLHPAGAEVELLRHDLALEQARRGQRVTGPQLDLQRLADVEGMGVDRLILALVALLVDHRDGAHVGQPQIAEDPHLADRGVLSVSSTSAPSIRTE